MLLRGWACRPPVNNLSSPRPDTSPSLKTAIYQLPFSPDFFLPGEDEEELFWGESEIYFPSSSLFSLQRDCLLPACRRPRLRCSRKKRPGKHDCNLFNIYNCFVPEIVFFFMFSSSANNFLGLDVSISHKIQIALQ